MPGRAGPLLPGLCELLGAAASPEELALFLLAACRLLGALRLGPAEPGAVLGRRLAVAVALVAFAVAPQIDDLGHLFGSDHLFRIDQIVELGFADIARAHRLG